MHQRNSARFRPSGLILNQRGFTLVELLVSVAVVAILAAVAIPAYNRYINNSRAKSAASDLTALALSMDNRFQLQLAYPVNAANTVATSALFPSWSPAMASHFDYKLVSTVNSYTLTATGKGASTGCTLTLTHAGAKTANSACGFTSW